MSAQQYIFAVDAEEAFYRKLDDLHNKYVYRSLMSGVAPKGTDLESIKMSKSPEINKKYCERVVGGLLNIKPEVTVRLVEDVYALEQGTFDGHTRLECLFTKINDNEHLNHLYMVQNVMDWPQIGNFSCQIWYLGETNISQINNHWN